MNELNIFEELNDILGCNLFKPLSNKEKIRLDIKENEDSYLVYADIPGVEKNRVKIEMENGCLKISVEDKQVKNDKVYLLNERNVMYDNREVCFEDVTDEGVKATFENGVLMVKVNKIKKENKYINIE